MWLKEKRKKRNFFFMFNIKIMTEQIKKALSEINWKTSTSVLNTVSFLSYALDEHNFSYDERLQENERRALKYSSILLAIASAHYAVMDVSKPSVPSEILIRYSDWLLTTPLLLMTLAAYYNLSSAVTRELVIYNVLMIVFGFFYEVTNNKFYWMIGSAAYGIILYRLYQTLPAKDLFYRFFVFGWGLYGIIALMPPGKRLIYYNVLDNYNKLIFAMTIRHRIIEDVQSRS